MGPPSRSVAELIRDARKARGLSQARLGELCGVSQQQVAKWEKGTNEPGLTHLRPLAQALGLTLDDLVPPHIRRPRRRGRRRPRLRQDGDLHRDEAQPDPLYRGARGRPRTHRGRDACRARADRSRAPFRLTPARRAHRSRRAHAAAAAPRRSAAETQRTTPHIRHSAPPTRTRRAPVGGAADPARALPCPRHRRRLRPC